MPLLDHFNPPLSRTHGWRSFHAGWASAMARLLNHGVLPPGYFAAPLADRGGPVEIDVATLRAPGPPSDEGGVATWAPPAPGLAVTVELPPLDGVAALVYTDDGDPRLVAAIELLSPRNKDRPAARQTFAGKCADYLRQGSSVVVVDTVTVRKADLNAAILGLLGVEPPATMPPGLSAVSYLATAHDEEKQRLEVWPAPLTLGQPLPTLPLWIAPNFSVPLDLEASYQAACADLRIHQADVRLLP